MVFPRCFFRCIINDMPVVGHIFTGIATGLLQEARPPHTPSTATGFMVPLAVTLSCLPDIISQVLLAVGYRDGHHLGHTVWLAIFLASTSGVVLHKFGFPTRTATAIPAVALTSHIVFDALQSDTLLPWWPFSMRPVFPDPLLPTGWQGEAIVLAISLFGWLAFTICRPAQAREAMTATFLPADRQRRILSTAFVMGVVVTALTTFILRERCEQDLESARRMIEAGSISEGFSLLASADRWPTTAKPGRINYFRGVGHLKHGEREMAEFFFLKAFRDDPRYLWVVIDLAILYAEDRQRSLEARRTIAAPFLLSLALDFPGHREAKQALDKAEKLLELRRQ